ncbi:MBL fold metallo-hydrolase [Streptomyces mirabilis]
MRRAGPGRVAASAGGLLVQRQGRCLLIDAGLGVADRDLGVAVSNSGALLDTLTALGHEPRDVEALAFTHLHTDHTGRGFVRDADGKLAKAFPKARYPATEAEWATYGRDDIDLGAPSRTDFIEPPAAVRTAIDDGEEVFPGVCALVTPGHSPGHTSYAISAGDGTRLFVFGDGFHVSGQITHPEWPSGPDVNHDAVRAASQRLLNELETPGTIGFAFHFGDQPFGRVTRDDSPMRRRLPVPSEAVLSAPRQIP